MRVFAICVVCHLLNAVNKYIIWYDIRLLLCQMEHDSVWEHWFSVFEIEKYYGIASLFGEQEQYWFPCEKEYLFHVLCIYLDKHTCRGMVDMLISDCACMYCS